MPESLARQRLASAPIFEGFSEAQREELLTIATEETYRPGAVVIHEGDPEQSLFILCEGTVEVVKQRSGGSRRNGQSSSAKPADEMHLATLIPPLIFGEMSFVRRAPHSATIRCVTPIRVLRIDRDAHDRLIERGSIAPYKLAMNINKVLAERLAQMDERIAGTMDGLDDHRQIEEWTQFRAKLYQDWEI